MSPAADLLDRDPLEALEAESSCRTGTASRGSGSSDGVPAASTQLPARDAADADGADVVVVVERR